jgi:hypothetical protein
MNRLVSGIFCAVGLGWAILGCGAGVIAPLPGGGNGLVLADSMTAAHFSLSVTDGAPTLQELGSAGTVSPDPGLVDEVTGTHYSLAVTSGALTLAPGLNTTPGSPRIGLADTATSKTYSLAVVSGALTLISN